MSSGADVVVVGGGVIGSSTAFHLKQAGAGDVLLLERDDFSQGTSAAGAGFVAQWGELMPEDRTAELTAELYALELYAELAAEGYGIDYFHNGMLLVAPDEETWKAIEPIRDADAPSSELVDGARVEELTSGAIAGDRIFGAIWHAPGIQVSAAMAGPALVDRFRKEGGVAETRRPVTAVRVENGRVTGVETPTGAVACDAVVLAAGAWSKELLRDLGVHLPIVPLITSRLVTEPVGIPETMPTLFLMGLDRSAFSTLWVRGQHGALLFGGHYDAPPREAFVGASLPQRFDQLALDGVFACRRLGEAAARFMPAFGRYESITVAHGAPCYTPDARGILGPVPGIEGLYVIAGDCEAGVSHAPGYGRAMADLVVHGETDFVDVGAWAFDRFDGASNGDEQIAAKMRERFGSRGPASAGTAER